MRNTERLPIQERQKPESSRDAWRTPSSTGVCGANVQEPVADSRSLIRYPTLIVSSFKSYANPGLPQPLDLSALRPRSTAASKLATGQCSDCCVAVAQGFLYR